MQKHPQLQQGEQGRGGGEGDMGCWPGQRCPPPLHPLAHLGELTSVSRLVSEGPCPVSATFAPFCRKGR